MKTVGTNVEFHLSFLQGLRRDQILFIQDWIESLSKEMDVEINVKVVKKHNQKITPAQEKEIAKFYWDKKLSAMEISNMFPCCDSTIVRIANKFKPSHLHARSFKSAKRILSDEIVLNILVDRNIYGYSLKELANRYNVVPTTIQAICTGRSWKHVYDKYHSLKEPQV